jgi:hypothetical protein
VRLWGCVLLAGCGFAVSTSDLGDLSVGDLDEPDLAVVKQLGEACGPGDSCAPGSGCADGVCCDNPFCAGCSACNSAGKCVPVTAGGDPHQACAGVVCADGCDGNGACRPASSTTICTQGACTQDLQYHRASLTHTTATLCSGTATGSCGTNTANLCPGNLACAPTKECFARCRWDADCVLNAYCDNGACVASGSAGATCARNAQCINGLVCVGGFCRQCATSVDCGAQPTQICDTVSHTCMGCVTANQCTASGWGSTCGGTCGCDTIGPTQCAAAAAPFCNGTKCVCGSGPVPCYPQEICSTNDVNGVCKVRTGEPCLADGDCNSGHCANGVCA